MHPDSNNTDLYDGLNINFAQEGRNLTMSSKLKTALINGNRQRGEGADKHQSDQNHSKQQLSVAQAVALVEKKASTDTEFREHITARMKAAKKGS